MKVFGRGFKDKMIRLSADGSGVITTLVFTTVAGSHGAKVRPRADRQQLRIARLTSAPVPLTRDAAADGRRKVREPTVQEGDSVAVAGNEGAGDGARGCGRRLVDGGGRSVRGRRRGE